MEMQSPMDLELPCLNPAPFPSPQTHYGGAEEGGIGGGGVLGWQWIVTHRFRL